MVIEQALLSIPSGQESAFEAAFARATPLIAASPGFLRLSLARGVETPGTYLFVVEWERLADHTEGFRNSDRYDEWARLLHHFYDPFPTVEHFTPVASG